MCDSVMRVLAELDSGLVGWPCVNAPVRSGHWLGEHFPSQSWPSVWCSGCEGFADRREEVWLPCWGLNDLLLESLF